MDLSTWLARIARWPIGRRFDPRAGELGWLQRWYAAQPAPRVVLGVLELDAAISRASLERALRALCARHPDALGVCEARTPSRLQVRPLRAADGLPWFEGSRERWELAAQMTHVAFAAGAPLFRVAIDGAQRHVLCAFDHLIADGVSVALLTCELARLLAGERLPSGEEAPLLPLDARLELRPALVDVARALSARRDGFLTAPRVHPPIGTLHTRILPLQLERSRVERLRERSREHHVTVHAGLSAAALMAALETLDQPTGILRLSTPISLRDQCRPSPSGTGVYIAGIHGDFEVAASDEPWELARRCHDDLRRKKPRAPHEIGMLALAGDLTALARKYDGRAHGRTATLEVSNVGIVRDVRAGTKLWVAQGAHYHNALFVLTVATSDGDGALRICFSFPEPLIQLERATRFLEALAWRLSEMEGG
jgi:hypothetical protein